MEPLTEQDFTLEILADGVTRLWVCKKQFSTALGALEVQLDTPPDPVVLGAAQEFTALAQSKSTEVTRALYAQYLDFAEHKSWMKAQGVPLNLDEDEVLKYVERITVYAGRAGDGRIEGGIFIRTKWDAEHGMRFAIREGRLVRLPQ
jgi:hypothetical protein